MALADDFASATPTPDTTNRKSPSLAQLESEAFARISRYEEAAIRDLRDDVDDALFRLGSKGLLDPDTAGSLIGVTSLAAAPSAAAANNDLVFTGNFSAEAAAADPEFGSVVLGTGNGEVTITCRMPGNGSQHVPWGDNCLITLKGGTDQSLAGEVGTLTIDGHKYLCLSIQLATTGTTVTTTAAELAALFTVDDAAWEDTALANAVGLYFSAAAGGTGADAMEATTAPVQFSGAEGGYYDVFVNGERAVVTDWGYSAGGLDVRVNATNAGDFPRHNLTAGNVVKFQVFSNGYLSELDVAVAA